MTNDRDIVRYEVNEHGELPLSYGRYVRYDDYEDEMEKLLGMIEHLRHELECRGNDYSDGYDDGYDACGGIEHAPEGEGDYVLYEEHCKVVEKLKAEIERLWELKVSAERIIYQD